MKKLLAVGVIVLFLGMSISSTTGFNVEQQSTIATLDGNTLYVGGSGAGNYSRIQDAIDNASDGDTVFVYDDSSPYYENIVVNKTINLIGEDRNTTIIDGGKQEYVINVTSDNATICSFTFENRWGDTCIILRADSCNILNNDIIEARHGIYLYKSNNCQIIDNFVSSKYVKIELESSHGNIIRGNNIEGKYKNDIMPVKGKGGYFPGIRLVGSNDNIIMDNNIYSNDFGAIELSCSSGNLITGNSCYNNGGGIWLYYACNNNISKNNISSTYLGIWVIASHKNCIMSNIVNENYGDGITIEFESTENLIINNTIESNEGHGIVFNFSSEHNFVQHNTIRSNKQGIRICGSSHNNSISENTLFNNGYGMYIIDSSNDNLIYYNQLINNTPNAYDECNNTWDNGYPSGGNYWSDYYGVDNFSGPNQNIPGSDGIGDTPYDLPCEYATDMYPLIEPYGMTKLTMIIKKGLLKFSGDIKNIGNKTAFNVQWNITFDGGFILRGRHSSGTLPKPLLSGEEMSISSNLVFGFGRILINITAWADNAPVISITSPGFLLLFFVIEGFEKPLIETSLCP